MISSGSDLSKSSLQIKQDDKFYTRLLSKESSVANPSFRVYYGVATGAVPFLWESQPGTPKHTSSASALPPLTPPPSYFSSPRSKIGSKNKSPKSSFIHAILPRFSLKRNLMMSPSSSLSLSSSSLSSSSSLASTGRSVEHRRRHSSSSSYFSSRIDDDESDGDSPTSTLCFGMRRRAAARDLRGCHPVVPVKNALLSVVGNGSRHGTAA